MGLLIMEICRFLGHTRMGCHSDLFYVIKHPNTLLAHDPHPAVTGCQVDRMSMLKGPVCRLNQIAPITANTPLHLPIAGISSRYSNQLEYKTSHPRPKTKTVYQRYLTFYMGYGVRYGQHFTAAFVGPSPLLLSSQFPPLLNPYKRHNKHT